MLFLCFLYFLSPCDVMTLMQNDFVVVPFGFDFVLLYSLLRPEEKRWTTKITIRKKLRLFCKFRTGIGGMVNRLKHGKVRSSLILCFFLSLPPIFSGVGLADVLHFPLFFHFISFLLPFFGGEIYLFSFAFIFLVPLAGHLSTYLYLTLT